jgi:hypothetical protein
MDAHTCKQCPYAQFCPLATTTPTDCAAGSYRNDTRATNQSDCYHCPANSYCPQKSYIPIACPANTGSVADSGSLLDCRCLSGYQCTYTKQISATVTLNSTASDFRDNINNVQTNFKAAIAAAAGVDVSKVVINGFSPQASGRRLLSVSGANAAPREVISVRATVIGATRLHGLSDHIAAKHSPFLHLDHTWAEAHRVVSLPVE